MGFLFHVLALPKVITVSFLINMLSQAKFLVIGALTHLGLYKPPPEENETTTDYSNDYIFIFDPSFPSLVPIPIHVVTSSIKTKVPVIKYGDLIRRKIEHPEEEENGEGVKMAVCTICLEAIELRDEVRELCNCSHVFHRGCLDRWVEGGKVTCPLCRSMLLPPKAILSSQNHTPAMAEEEEMVGDVPSFAT